jgi:4-amino-4-deoxy-L-arabinose transferase-like glycosyltransferase
LKNIIVKYFLNNLKQIKKFTFFFILLSLGLVVRVVNLSQIPPPLHPDEAEMTLSAYGIITGTRHLLDSYMSVTVLGNSLTALLIYLFGFSIEVSRLQSVFFGFLSAIFIYLLIREIFNKQLALIAFFLSLFSHVAIAFSRINIPNIQVPFFLFSSLYFIALAFRTKRPYLFWISGVITGFSMYSYTSAKVIVLIDLLFIAIHLKKDNWKQVFLFVLGFFTLIIPLLVYISQPANNYLQRESEVSLLSHKEEYFARWHSTSIVYILAQQFKTNLLAFISIPDGSTHYSHYVLLDSISTILFLFFFFITFFLIYYRKKILEEKYLVFFILVFIGLLFLISFTDSPPLSPRLVVAYPLALLFVSVTIYIIQQIFSRLNRHLGTFITIIILMSIAFLNIKMYFFDYTQKNDAYYEWIEPNSSIGIYISKHPYRNIYILSNPHTYSDTSIIRVLTKMKENISDITTINEAAIAMDSINTSEIIIPEVPADAIKSSYDIKKFILANSDSMKFHIKSVEGFPCQMCKRRSIFLVIYK